MSSKSHIWCANCQKPIGFVWGNPALPEAYCYACEAFITHKEEDRQKSYMEYRAALDKAGRHRVR